MDGGGLLSVTASSSQRQERQTTGAFAFWKDLRLTAELSGVSQAKLCSCCCECDRRDGVDGGENEHEKRSAC